MFLNLKYMIKSIRESKIYKSITWLIALFAVLSMIFTTLTIMGENNFAQLTFADETASSTSSYRVDISGVSERQKLIERLELTADKARIAEEKAELKEREMEVNARSESLE